MLGAGTGDPPGKYLSPFGDKTPQYIRILVIDLKFLDAKFTNLLFEVNFSLSPAPIFPIPAVYLGFDSPFLPGGPIIRISLIRHTSLLWDPSCVPFLKGGLIPA
jgi:hypothetical protein